MGKKLNKFRRDPTAYLSDSAWPPLRWLGHVLLEREQRRYVRASAARDCSVDVLMTAYNTADLVGAAAQSVLAQSHPHLTLWILDDASTDATAEKLAQLAAHDTRVRAFSSPVNRGTYWCKNWLLSQSAAEFVTFQDSDDQSDPLRLQIQLGSLITNPKQVANTVRWRRVDPHGAPVVMGGRASRMAAISLMVRRKQALGQLGAFDSVRFAADSEFIARLSRVFGQRAVRHLPFVLYTGLVRSGSLTQGGGGQAWSEVTDGQSVRSVGTDRAAYHAAYSQWHQEAGSLKIDFPMRARPFEVPSSLVRGVNLSGPDPMPLGPTKGDPSADKRA